MTQRYSIAEARRHLSAVVDAAKTAGVELTRRGQPIAVVISVEQYSRFTNGRARFADAYKKFRHEFPEGRGGIPTRFLRSLRDRGEGRKVRF